MGPGGAVVKLGGGAFLGALLGGDGVDELLGLAQGRLRGDLAGHRLGQDGGSWSSTSTCLGWSCMNPALGRCLTHVASSLCTGWMLFWKTSEFRIFLFAGTCPAWAHSSGAPSADA